MKYTIIVCLLCYNLKYESLYYKCYIRVVSACNIYTKLTYILHAHVSRAELTADLTAFLFHIIVTTYFCSTLDIRFSLHFIFQIVDEGFVDSDYFDHLRLVIRLHLAENVRQNSQVFVWAL